METGGASTSAAPTAAAEEALGQRTVKCTLSGAINKAEVPVDRRRDLLDAIERVVLNTSQLMRRASLLLRLHCLRLLEGGNPAAADALLAWNDTRWRQLLLIGSPGARFQEGRPPDAALVATHAAYAAELVLLPGWARTQGDGQTMTFAAQQLQTVFTNNLWVPLMPRLKRLCRAWLDAERARAAPAVRVRLSATPRGEVKVRISPASTATELEGLTALQMQRAIENGDRVELAPGGAAAGFVAGVRARLGLAPGERLTEAWARAQSAAGGVLLRFNWWVHQQLVGCGRRGIALTPILKVRRQHVSFDTAALYNVARAACPWVAEADTLADKRAALDKLMVAPRRPGWAWTHFLTTDGVGAGFAMRRVNEKAPARKKSRHKPAGCPPPPAPGKKGKKAAAAAKQAAVTAAQRSAAEGPHVVLGLDPGRHSIAYAAARLPDGGEPFERSLSGKHYRNCAGLTRARARQARWDATGAARWAHLAQAGGLGSATVDGFVAYLRACLPVARDWWADACVRKRAVLRMRTFGGRKRALDTWFGATQRALQAATPGRRVLVAYGAATFSPSGHGQVATPTTAAYKACVRSFGARSVFKQGECRTSRQCCDCHADVHACWQRVELVLGAGKGGAEPLEARLAVRSCRGPVAPRAAAYQRGLLFCPSCSKHLNRDRCGALNIAFLFEETQLRGLPTPPAFQARRRATAAAA